MSNNLIFASIYFVKQHFKNINVGNVTENKKFWKTIRLFSNQCKIANTIILIENDKISQGDKVNANTFIGADEVRWNKVRGAGGSGFTHFLTTCTFY